MENSILILSQVIYKGFVELEKRQPLTDADTELMATAMLKTYKAGLIAQNKINSFKK